MGLVVNGAGGPAPAPAEDDGEETDEQFEERVYSALMRVARSTSSKTRDQLGACVLLGRPYASAGESVRAVIRDFIAVAEL
jgi:hypothetical protein